MSDDVIPSMTIPLKRDSQRICVVCPCYFEEEGIAEFYKQLKSVLVDLPEHYDHAIVLVDDGSGDGTLAELNRIAKRDSSVHVYSLSRNRGHQVALSAGLDVADGDAVIMMDSDLQHPPELIPEMLHKWETGNEIVLAVRQHTEDASLLKRLTSDGFYSVFNFLSDVQLTPGAADFCLLSRRAHQALRAMPERRRFLRGMIAWMGFPTAKISYTAPARFAGCSKYDFRRMIALALDATFSFSTRPIRLASKAGLMCIVLGWFYLSYAVGRYFLIGDLAEGWASIVGMIVLMGGIQLLSIGLIGEYVARIFEEVKGRPLYLFRENRDSIALGEAATFDSENPLDPSTEIPQINISGDKKCA